VIILFYYKKEELGSRNSEEFIVPRMKELVALPGVGKLLRVKTVSHNYMVSPAVINVHLEELNK
jgi:hypothetical protein